MAYYSNSKIDNVDFIEASDLESIETGFANVDTDKANKVIPATINDFAALSATGDLVDSGKTPPSGEVVGDTDTQTLTNKTLTLPKINDTSSDHQYIFAVSELAANRTVTLPLLTGNDTYVFEAHSQTLTNKTLTSPVLDLPQINDSSDSHKYIFGVSELVANRTITLPLLTANDVFVFEGHTQTLTNKTLTTPTINGAALSGNLSGNPDFTGSPTKGSAVLATTTGTETLSNKTLTLPQINDSSASHKYIFAVSELTANRTVTLPLLTNSDTFAFTNQAQTFTNKTLSSPVMSGTVSGNHTVSGNVTFTGTVSGIAQNVTLQADGNIFCSEDGLALEDLTTGDHNIAFGDSAGANISTANNSIAIGQLALWGDATSKLTGADNIGIGERTGFKLTTGYSNVLFGLNAGYKLTTGFRNVFIGEDCGGIQTGSAITGDYNIGAGYKSLYNVTSGNYNISFGLGAGHDLDIGSNNVFIGQNAGYNCDDHDNNTFVGAYAGDLSNGGNNVTCLGYQADPSAAGTSNEFTLGNSSVATLRCQQTTITALSDRRDKKDIQPLKMGIEFIKALLPVSFTWNMRDGGIVGAPDLGFIAQDLQKAQNKTGFTVPGLVYDVNPEKLEASYGKLLPIIVQALKDLSERCDLLEAQLQGV